jgi:nucleoid-associated protein YgaU
MPEEERSAVTENEGAVRSGEETQAKASPNASEEPGYDVAERIAAYEQAAAEEERKRQEEADTANLNQQVRAVNEAKAATRTYTVESGDSLSAIALSVYGDAGRWPEIFEANKHQLSNPNLIYPGQELRIP